MNNNFLTREECNALRGLAIAGIVLHNFCHWLRPVVKENEYQFFHRNVAWLNNVIEHADRLLPAHLFSFFGHYGVPVFLFLSAYGLSKKYEKPLPQLYQRGNGNDDVLTFIWTHFRKLFTMMIMGFVIFTMVDAITPGSHRYHLLDVVAQLGMFNNVLPHPNNIIWPGPYWFFGLMMQFYLLFRLVLYRRHWGFTVGLIVVCLCIQLMCDPEGEALNRWRYNFVGGMLPFGMGLLTARYGEEFSWRSSVIMLLPSLLMMWYMSQSFLYWLIAPMAVVFAGVCFVKTINTVNTQWLMKVFTWLGTISAALFVTHPVTRKIFIPLSHSGDIYTGLLLYVISSLVVATWFNKLIANMSAGTSQKKASSKHTSTPKQQ